MTWSSMIWRIFKNKHFENMKINAQKTTFILFYFFVYIAILMLIA